MEKTRIAKIATAQCTVETDVRRNGQSIRKQIQLAKDAGADLVHFCEGALSGYVKHHISDFSTFDWKALDEELGLTAALCASLKIWAVLGSCHKVAGAERPKNSLYIIDANGTIRARYDKRFCSHSEITDWFSSGSEAVFFEINGIRFGCAICIEIQFPEVFLEYEKLDVDCVLFSSYSETAMFGIQAQGHAACNNYWLSMSVPTNKSEKLPANFISPNGKVLQRCLPREDSIILNEINPEDESWEIPLKRARPWRRNARKGEIVQAKKSGDLKGETAARILDELMEASETVTAFLTWTELEGAVQKNLYAVSTRKTLQDIQRRLANRFSGRLTIEVPQDFYVLAGIQHFELMVLNLILNALSYSPPDQPVVVKLDGARGITISDAGPGIPEGVIERIGEPFNKGTRPSTGGKGHGLGLAYVKSVCNLYGWDLAIDRPREKGTVVRLRFPDTDEAALAH